MTTMTDFQYEPNIKVVRAARTFIKAVCEEYGESRGLEFWDNIRKNLGEDIAGDIFFGMISDAGRSEILVRTIGPNKINAIKEIRTLTGWGLKESKDFTDDVEAHGPKTLRAPDYIEYERVQTFVDNMRRFGAIVD